MQAVRTGIVHPLPHRRGPVFAVCFGMVGDMNWTEKVEMSNIDRDQDAARREDQDSVENDGMRPMGGKGPSAASAADTPGAFGDAMRPDGELDNVDETLVKGAMEVGGERRSTQP